MILCIPYHPSLPLDYKKLASHLKTKGSHPSHSLMVVCNYRHEEEAFSFSMGLAKLFARQELVVTPDYPDEAPVRASNRLFAAAMKAFHKYVSQPPEHPTPAMLYYDPIYRPVKNRWLDDIQSEYYLKDAPMVLANFVKGLTVGPVVFGSKYPKSSKLIDFVPETTHWRRYLASELVKDGVETEAFGESADAYIRPYTPET